MSENSILDSILLDWVGLEDQLRGEGVRGKSLDEIQNTALALCTLFTPCLTKDEYESMRRYFLSEETELRSVFSDIFDRYPHRQYDDRTQIYSSAVVTSDMESNLRVGAEGVEKHSFLNFRQSSLYSNAADNRTQTIDSRRSTRSELWNAHLSRFAYTQSLFVVDAFILQRMMDSNSPSDSGIAYFIHRAEELAASCGYPRMIQIMTSHAGDSNYAKKQVEQVMRIICEPVKHVSVRLHVTKKFRSHGGGSVLHERFLMAMHNSRVIRVLTFGDSVIPALNQEQLVALKERTTSLTLWTVQRQVEEWNAEWTRGRGHLDYMLEFQRQP